MKLRYKIPMLVTGCLMLVGCGVFQGRQSPGSYEGGKSDSWTSHKPAPWPTNANIMPPMSIARQVVVNTLTAPSTSPPPARVNRFTVISTMLTVIQSSTDLSTGQWLDRAVGTNLVTSTTNAVREFFRTKPDVRVVHLSWEASPSPGVTAYRIYSGPVTGGYVEVQEVGNITETTSVFRLFPTNHFVLTAVSSGGESDFSNEETETGSPSLSYNHEP